MAKKHKHEEHVNHEAWVIPYADLLTLLMAMFIALFALSTIDKSKFKQFSLGFNQALGGKPLETGLFASNSGDAAISNGLTVYEQDRKSAFVTELSALAREVLSPLSVSA